MYNAPKDVVDSSPTIVIDHGYKGHRDEEGFKLNFKLLYDGKISKDMRRYK